MTQSISFDPAAVSARVYMALLFLPTRLTNIPWVTRLSGSMAPHGLPMPDAGAAAAGLAVLAAVVTLALRTSWNLPVYDFGMLPDPSLLLAFVGASLVLALTPGPAVVYIVARTLAQGRASGLASVLGVALGNLSNAVGAAIGLAALFTVSSAAFTVVKWAGAAYLVYLGIRMWQAAPAIPDAAPQAPVQPLRRVFRDGFMVALLNPKTTLFFAAYLPQFIDPHAGPLVQTVALGAVFVAIACCTDLVYVLTASLVGPRLNRAGRHAVWGNRLAGTSLIGLGVLTAMGTRPAR